MPPDDAAYHDATEALQHATWQKALTALIVLAAFVVAAKLVGWLVRRALSRPSWGGPVFALSKLLTYTLGFIGLLSALGVLGLPISSLLLPSSALLVGVGFSLQPITRDFIAGVIILVEQPIRLDDFVTFGDIAGTVREIGLRATHLRTLDGMDLVVPNHLLVSTELTNHSHPLQRERLSIDVPVSLREDAARVSSILSGVARGQPGVLDEPEPTVHLDGIHESHLRLVLVVWVSNPAESRLVASALRFSIARAFAEEKVQFPTPELACRVGFGEYVNDTAK
jgi:small-conductance mechanosensitive channel